LKDHAVTKLLGSDQYERFDRHHGSTCYRLTNNECQALARPGKEMAYGQNGWESLHHVLKPSLGFAVRRLLCASRQDSTVVT